MKHLYFIAALLIMILYIPVYNFGGWQAVTYYTYALIPAVFVLIFIQEERTVLWVALNYIAKLFKK